MAALAGLGLALGRPCLAAESGTLTALVRDPAVGTLPGATVIVSLPTGQEVARQTTNGTGEARFVELPVGAYEVKCELPGLELDYVALVRVKPRLSNRVTLTMSIATGGGGTLGDIMVVPIDTIGIMLPARPPAPPAPPAPVTPLPFGKSFASLCSGMTSQ